MPESVLAYQVIPGDVVMAGSTFGTVEDVAQRDNWVDIKLSWGATITRRFDSSLRLIGGRE